jgi:hypothetical protein
VSLVIAAEGEAIRGSRLAEWIASALVPRNTALQALPALRAPFSQGECLFLSLHGWEDVMRVSLALAAKVAVIVGLSTWFVVQLQREEIRLSNERIVAAELETERVRKEFGPRNLNWNAFIAALMGAAQVQLEILYVVDDADSMELAQ